MTKSSSWYEIDETTPKNRFLLRKVKQFGGVRALARKIGVYPVIISSALNKKHISDEMKLKIARFFGKDTIEIWNYENEK